mgnify:CR=1 FL=1
MNKKKSILVACGTVVAVAAIGAGIFAATHSSGGKSVKVYSFDIVGMTDYWGDSQESYGPVRSDNIQTVMLSDTQTVTGVKVKEGDTVKKGDLLLSFDTTLTDLALEKKRLSVEQLKLQLQQEEARLGELLDTPPYTPPTVVETEPVYDDYQEPEETEEPITELTVSSKGEKDEYRKDNYPGSSKDNPVICSIPRESTSISDEMLGKVKTAIETKRKIAKAVDSGELQELDYVIAEYFAVFKATEDNLPSSTKVFWQGAHVSCGGGKYTIELFDASKQDDFSFDKSILDKPTIPIPSFTPPSYDDDTADQGPSYTKEELTQMIEQQRKTILDVKYKIKVAEAEYSIAQREANDGNIYAEVDGKVVSVLSQEEAKENQQPIIKVSGGGGFYISGSISELNREKLAIGSEVTVTDYRNGGVYTGTVESVGDFPTSDDNYYGNGNPNVSYYPFTVFVDESADLVGGNYVNIQYSLSQGSGGIYLQNPFVRKEKGESFVYVQGENGKLEKRTVATGKSVWGSYTEILSGITMEDKLAFPYGKTVKPGAPTEEGDYSTLYEQ